MTQEIRDKHVLITAAEGYFLANADKSIYGIGLWLGINDSPENYNEYPMSEYPESPEIIEPDMIEPEIIDPEIIDPEIIDPEI